MRLRNASVSFLPYALEHTYRRANREWAWHYGFSSDRLSVDPRSGVVRRHHRDESGLQKAIRRAAQQAGIPTLVTPHPFRHSFAPHWLQAGDAIRTVQELLGHKDVRTTMI